MLQQVLTERLAQRSELGLLRKPLSFDEVFASKLVFNGKSFINFSSNDYLAIGSESVGLSKSSGLDKATSLHKGVAGSLASPLVVGKSEIHDVLERELLNWLDAPSDHQCMLFSSGYAANNGVISALLNQKSQSSALYQDKLNHASLLEAGSSAQAKGHVRQLRFAHNDLENFEKLLATKGQSYTDSLAVTEGVFSMDGDSPDLAAFSSLCRNSNIMSMVDDAHGVGVRGKNGRGSIDACGLTLGDIDIYVVTFGKAFGAQGAAVIADKSIIEYLSNFSKEYIYSTHLSPLQSHAVLTNLKQLQAADEQRARLQENIKYFRTGMQNLTSEKNSLQLIVQSAQSLSPIQPIIVGDEMAAVALSDKLKSRGIWAGAMRYPTVAKGEARLRVTITSAHTEADIKHFLEVLHDEV